MNEQPDVLEQVPAGGGMNKPASGTYGEKTELAALQQALPGAEPTDGPPSPSPVPPGLPSGRSMQAPPPGIPGGLLAPSRRPDVPVSTPLANPTSVDPMAGAVTAAQRRLRLLDALSTHPDASPEVKEWAESVKQKLIARG